MFTTLLYRYYQTLRQIGKEQTKQSTYLKLCQVV